MSNSVNFPLHWVALAGVALFVSCEDDSAVVIAEVRDLEGAEQEIRIVDSPSERYRLPGQMGASGGGAVGRRRLDALHLDDPGGLDAGNRSSDA